MSYLQFDRSDAEPLCQHVPLGPQLAHRCLRDKTTERTPQAHPGCTYTSDLMYSCPHTCSCRLAFFPAGLLLLFLEEGDFNTRDADPNSSEREGERKKTAVLCLSSNEKHEETLPDLRSEVSVYERKKEDDMSRFAPPSESS